MHQIQPGGAFVVQICESPFFQICGVFFIFGYDAGIVNSADAVFVGTFDVSFPRPVAVIPANPPSGEGRPRSLEQLLYSQSIRRMEVSTQGHIDSN